MEGKTGGQNRAVVAVAVAEVFVWAVRSGQLDDLDTPAVRILSDDDDERSPAD